MRMFNPAGFSGRVLRLGQSLRNSAASHGTHKQGNTNSNPTLRRLCLAAAAGAAANAAPGVAAKVGIRLTSTAMMLGGGAAVAYSQMQEGGDGEQQQQEQLVSSNVPWVKTLEDTPGIEEMLSPGQLLRRHPVAKYLVDQDHLFEAMASNLQIREFRCFYDPKGKKFHSVVQLGKDVCGFPQTVHGGLTAAIVDETFGGLGVCMWRSGALGARLPAYTARLEVDFKRKIPAGALILCSTELDRIEDRKIWMRASVTDGNGTVYAQARALFVAPSMPGEKIARGLFSWLPGRRRQQAAAAAAAAQEQQQ